MGMFDQIRFDAATGALSFPQLEGFHLDMEKVERTAELFVGYFHGDVVMAVRQAVHQQLIAHQGAAALRR